MNIVKFTATIDDATNKALKMAENGDLRGAEKQWTLAIDVYENGGDGVVLSPQALYRLGKTLAQRADCRADLGTLEKSEVKLLGAVDDYAKAIDIQSSPEMKVKLGTILTLLGRFAEGDKELDAVIDGNVGNEIKGRAYTNRGISKQRQQLWVDAVKDFTEASELTKGNDEVLKNLALAKIEAGDAKGALIMLRDQAKKIPKGTYIEGAEDVPAALAAAEFVAGNADKARAALDKVTDIRFRDLRFVREARFWGPRLSKGLEAALAAPKTAPQPKASSAKSAKPVASPPAGAPKTPAAPAPPAPEAEAAESVEAPAAAAL